MPVIRAIELPEGALLKKYKHDGAYTDCYAMDLPGTISMSEYVDAFYTSRLFKLERVILARFAAKPSADEDARQLAQGQATRFSAWRVEGREANQLLLCDFLGRTRSWLMVTPLEDNPSRSTRLYFGSAVVPKSMVKGVPRFGFAFHALHGFHLAYTRALMRSARSKLGM